MARILICEPDAEVRRLLELLVGRLGHEPVGCAGAEARPELLLVEPASPEAVAQAREARRRAGPLPVVFASILPPSPETHELEPVVHLVKPVRLDDLGAALRGALTAARV